MRVRRLFTMAVGPAIAFATLALTPAPANAVTGSFAGRCSDSFGNGPFSMTIEYDVDMPTLVDGGEHFTVPVSVTTPVGENGELSRAFLTVSGAVPDEPGSQPNLVELFPAAPGDDALSATVGLTAIPGAREVRLAIAVRTKPYAFPTSVSCSGPVVARAFVDTVAPVSDPAISIGDATANEGTLGSDRSIRVPITLSSPSTTEVAVNVLFTGGTATPGSRGVGDVAKQRAVRTIRFKPSPRTGLTPTTKTLNVKVYPDAAVESDETLAFDLASPTSGYGIYRGHGTATVRDDDSIAGVTLSIGDVSVVEGLDGLRTLRTSVDLSEPLAQDLSVSISFDPDRDFPANCAISPGVNPPLPGPDIDCKVPKNLKLRAGTVSRTVTFVVYPDTTMEFDEEMVIKALLFGPTNPTALAIPGTVTVLDDE